GAGVRAILESEYYTGDGESALSAAGWYDGNSGDTTHAVGALRGTTTGLYDLHGNVEEWCRDAWSADSYARISWGQLDPEVRASDVGASESDAQRVVRGGSWGSAPRYCRATIRYRRYPGYRLRFRGFRVCACSGPR
ncbi:MAG: formylglycine-generating enzyme family protein, partial [Planctomycetaceae bacterium]